MAVTQVEAGSNVDRSTLLAFSVGVKLITVAINVALGVTAIAVMLGSVRWKHRVEADAAGRI